MEYEFMNFSQENNSNELTIFTVFNLELEKYEGFHH